MIPQKMEKQLAPRISVGAILEPKYTVYIVSGIVRSKDVLLV